MTCPTCGAPDTRVTRTDKGPEPKRRRRCPACGHRWNTIERAEDAPQGALVPILAPIPVELIGAVLARDHSRCRYCGRQGNLRLQRIAVRPGPPTAADLVSCCATCDRERQSRPALAATNAGAPAISSGAQLPVADRSPRPPPTNDASPATNSGGGVGGGLSSGSHPDPVNPVVSDPDPVLDRGREVDRAREPAAAPRVYAPQAAYRFNHLGTNTEAFLRVYHRYPNKVGKNTASQVFRELAESYEGGEQALSAAILGAFGHGMLKRRPYLDEKEGVRFCPALERFLERRLWEDEVPPDDAQPSAYKKLE